MRYTSSDATVSDCQKYRYRLTRHWKESGPLIGWVGLNPSTADANDDDPTIRRVVGFSQQHGFSGCVMGNLFAYRSTDPKGLPLDEQEAVGRHNDYWLNLMGMQCEIVVAAWGAVSQYEKRIAVVLRDFENLGKSLHCFGLTKGGFPRHPLYLPKDSPLIFYKVFL